MISLIFETWNCLGQQEVGTGRQLRKLFYPLKKKFPVESIQLVASAPAEAWDGAMVFGLSILGIYFWTAESL